MPRSFCTACGCEARTSDRFCRACGEALTDDAAPLARISALAEGGRLSEAIAETTRALAAAPDDADLHIALALLQLRAGALHSALDELARALALDPRSPVAHAYTGALLLRQGHVDAARDHLDRARALAPHDLTVALKRAEFWLALGILGNARDELRDALRDGGGSPATRAAAARMLASVEARMRRAITRRTPPLPSLNLLRAAGRTRPAPGKDRTNVEVPSWP